MADGNGPLFDWSPPAPSAPKAPDQAAELARALSALELHVMAFLRERMRGPAEGRLFHMDSLRAFVAEKCKAAGTRCAPDSPRRVMRELEAQGQCQVPLRSRSQSLYEVIAVAEE